MTPEATPSRSRPHVVLGVSGGIAAYKACELLRRLTETGHDVTVVPAASALAFVGAPTWAALSGKPVSSQVWDHVHEVPHVRIGQEADLVVVAPATADVMAKAAHGMADDLLTNTLLTARCPVVFVPAMHTEMWEHPATVANVATLRGRGVVVVEPAEGRLTGKDTGKGRFPEPAEIFELAVAGEVFLANAPGNGVADDKAMYCNVPELIGYYHDEHPTLEAVPTYRTSDEAEARIVLDRVGELVTKPVDGHGGIGVLIGPDSSAAEVAERRSAIAADPGGWVAQEVVALSSHPTLSGTRLQPRHVDLRAFVYLRGTEIEDCTLADLALTRVAPAGSLVVNSSRGGGAKDTWILGED